MTEAEEVLAPGSSPATVPRRKSCDAATTRCRLLAEAAASGADALSGPGGAAHPPVLPLYTWLEEHAAVRSSLARTRAAARVFPLADPVLEAMLEEEKRGASRGSPLYVGGAALVFDSAGVGATIWSVADVDGSPFRAAAPLGPCLAGSDAAQPGDTTGPLCRLLRATVAVA